MGGVAVLASLGAFDLANHLLTDWSVLTIAAGILAAGLWWFDPKKTPKTEGSLSPVMVDPTVVQTTLNTVERVIAQLQTEAAEADSGNVDLTPTLSQLHRQIAQISQEVNREELRIGVFGAKSTGKTSLIQELQTQWIEPTSCPASLTEAPSLLAKTETGWVADVTALQLLQQVDLILFLVTGDITAAEFAILQQAANQRRTMLVLNKHDQFLPSERELLLNRLQHQVQGLVSAEDVVVIATNPKPLKVRQYQADGAIAEHFEEQAPDLSSLLIRLNYFLTQQRRQLVLASSFSDAVALKAEARRALNGLRRTRALPVIEKYQWIAAATAFASPIPTLDVLATTAINAQMILDLGALYQQKFSLQQAHAAVTALGSLMLKLGLVELSTRAIATLLKTNAVTYVAGGAIQAASAAYLTHVAGLSLIAYFDSQDPNLSLEEAKPLSLDRLTQILESVFQQNQQASFLQTFVGQVLERVTASFSTAKDAARDAIAPTLEPVQSASAFPPVPDGQVLSSLPLPIADNDNSDNRDSLPTTLAPLPLKFPETSPSLEYVE